MLPGTRVANRSLARDGDGRPSSHTRQPSEPILARSAASAGRRGQDCAAKSSCPSEKRPSSTRISAPPRRTMSMRVRRTAHQADDVSLPSAATVIGHFEFNEGGISVGRPDKNWMEGALWVATSSSALSTRAVHLVLLLRPMLPQSNQLQTVAMSHPTALRPEPNRSAIRLRHDRWPGAWSRSPGSVGAEELAEAVPAIHTARPRCVHDHLRGTADRGRSPRPPAAQTIIGAGADDQRKRPS